MFIEIRNIPEGKKVEERILTLPKELAQAGGIKPEVSSRLEIRRLQDTLFVEIEFEGLAQRDCDRCLRSYEQEVTGKVSFVLQHVDSEEDYTEGESDCYVYDQEDEEIDFSQTLYDAMMLQMGYKSICSPDCRGLESPLKDEPPVKEEEEKTVDPRWAALGKLKKK